MSPQRLEVFVKPHPIRVREISCLLVGLENYVNFDKTHLKWFTDIVSNLFVIWRWRHHVDSVTCTAYGHVADSRWTEPPLNWHLYTYNNQNQSISKTLFLHVHVLLALYPKSNG